ncbi:hypothetical protein GCM10022207_39120 [Streptomyces lannensis]|uniref:Uncharacterized protein n=1 Tax=Streptomyces lannensis TaxID=766498 RepID=A0ABP7K9D1_9ACTN
MRTVEDGAHLGIGLQQRVQQMGGVHLPVPVPLRPSARARHHRGQFVIEPWIVIQVVCAALRGRVLGLRQ